MSPSAKLFLISDGLRKGARTRIKLIHCAFLCIARDGYYRTTFQTIANRAQLSQPLVVKVFKTSDQIFPIVAGYLLNQAILDMEARLSVVAPTGSGLKLRTYVEVLIGMFESNPDLARFYLNIHYLSAYNPSARKFNDGIRQRAIKRLAGVLKARPGRARKTRENQEIGAALHDYLAGFILNTISLGQAWDKDRLFAGLESGFLKA